MPTLLRLDSSSRADGSHSRTLGDQAELAWTTSNPDREILRRDLADSSIPVIAHQTIQGSTGDEAAVATAEAGSATQAAILSAAAAA